MEGIGTILAGVFGTTSGVTSFSQNIAAIYITKVGSRIVRKYVIHKYTKFNLCTIEHVCTASFSDLYLLSFAYTYLNEICT